MSERARIYISGPLNGQAAETVNGRWPHFRDEYGQSLDDENTIDVTTGMPSTARQAYYLAALPQGGWSYVHLSLWDDYLKATVFAAAHVHALVEHRRCTEAATH